MAWRSRKQRIQDAYYAVYEDAHKQTLARTHAHTIAALLSCLAEHTHTPKSTYARTRNSSSPTYKHL